MFESSIINAKAAAVSLIAKYFARASVALPFLVALGFATAAITHILVERYGEVTAYWIMAAGFAVSGVVAMLAVSTNEREKEVAEEQVEQNDAARVAPDATAQATLEAALALLAAGLATPLGRDTVAAGTKMAASNMPLIILLALIALLFWPVAPTSETPDLDDEATRTPRPNGAHQPSSNDMHRESA
jgi:hypothetical protein